MPENPVIQEFTSVNMTLKGIKLLVYWHIGTTLQALKRDVDKSLMPVFAEHLQNVTNKIEQATTIDELNSIMIGEFDTSIEDFFNKINW